MCEFVPYLSLPSFYFSDCHCQILEVSLSGNFINQRYDAGGMYKLSETVAGKPSWIKIVGSIKYAIWYSSNYKCWLFSSAAYVGLLDSNAVISSYMDQDDVYKCPHQIPRDYWNYYAGNEWMPIDFQEFSFQCTGMKIE